MTEYAVAHTRTIAAPRPRGYRALLDPEMLARWMCPPSSVVRTATVDERVGGVHRVEMLAPDGGHHMFDSTILDLVEVVRVLLYF